VSSLKKSTGTKDKVRKKNTQTTQLKKKNKLVINDKKKIDFKKYLTKVNITYFMLFILDIILVIYFARKNVVNYVVISDVEIFVSKTRYLLWGRNYVNLIVIAFFYVYICLINKFFLHQKNTKKFLIWLLVILVVLNVLLFVLFTKRIY